MKEYQKAIIALLFSAFRAWVFIGLIVIIINSWEPWRPFYSAALIVCGLVCSVAAFMSVIGMGLSFDELMSSGKKEPEPAAEGEKP